MKTQHKILVVDDDPVVGKSFERVLSSKGYAVINCHSGEEALAKLKNEEYDAVFTDLKMPGMDGIEVATQVKASQPWMPVIIVTGFGTTNSQLQASEIGVSDFIQKPLTPEMIEASAERAMLEKESVEEVEGIVPEQVQQPASQSKLMGIALFLMAPFIGLLYALALPLVGVAMLAISAYKAAAKNDKVRLTAQVIAAPFVGLAFAVVAPIAGLGALAWIGLTAAIK